MHFPAVLARLVSCFTTTASRLPRSSASFAFASSSLRLENFSDGVLNDLGEQHHVVFRFAFGFGSLAGVAPAITVAPRLAFGLGSAVAIRDHGQGNISSFLCHLQVQLAFLLLLNTHI